MIGLGIGILQQQFRGPRFTPAALFAAGEEGAWFEPSLTTCFTDTAGTTAAAVGDAVARINDSSGNDSHATQATAAARPILREDADGQYYLQNDEADDALTVTFPNMGTSCTVGYITASEVRLLEDQAISGAYTLPATDLYNIVVIDRALTIPEKISLIRYLASNVKGVNYGAEIDRLTLIAINAVDVFVYDTSKDSDGGAWATNYPAQMAIVAEDTAIKIYDATDPGLPLHTTLDFTGYTVTALTAVSGVLAVATATGLATFNLADGDTTVALDYTTSTTPDIVNNACNDCAMTVLPDAPIDPATGLPVPTIAVATDGGVSVIKDDGTVVSSSDTSAFDSVAYTHDSYVALGMDGSSFPLRISQSPADNLSAGWLRDTFKWNDPTAQPAILDNNVFDVCAAGKNLGIATAEGLQLFDVANESYAWISPAYNTGWMNGDIKGAFLSDTDDTDLVGSGELVTNGTFDTDTSGWTSTRGAALSYNSGTIQVSGNNSTAAPAARQVVATVAGKVYAFEYEVTATDTFARVGVTNGVSDFGTLRIVEDRNIGVGKHVLYFVALSSQSSILMGSESALSTNFVQFDNVSVKLADEDRSVNNNGLVINGTVSRDPVSSGADLVAYSGFSASNYLEQPYNPDLDFGTGDFCVMGWVKINVGNTDTFMTAISRVAYNGSFSGSGFEVSCGGYNVKNKLLIQVTDDGYSSIDSNLKSSSDAQSAASLAEGVWNFVVFKLSNQTGYVYLNAEEYFGSGFALSNAGGGITTNTSAKIRVGFRGDATTQFDNGALALWRISATAPTADQIAKIYNDEKVLFEENAQATLYGSSDAVTALAHDPDTDLLHVGTSAGRSVFRGLERLSNTTTSVSTAISATGGLVISK